MTIHVIRTVFLTAALATMSLFAKAAPGIPSELVGVWSSVKASLIVDASGRGMLSGGELGVYFKATYDPETHSLSLDLRSVKSSGSKIAALYDPTEQTLMLGNEQMALRRTDTAVPGDWSKLVSAMSAASSPYPDPFN